MEKTCFCRSPTKDLLFQEESAVWPQIKFCRLLQTESQSVANESAKSARHCNCNLMNLDAWEMSWSLLTLYGEMITKIIRQNLFYVIAPGLLQDFYVEPSKIIPQTFFPVRAPVL